MPNLTKLFFGDEGFEDILAATQEMYAGASPEQQCKLLGDLVIAYHGALPYRNLIPSGRVSEDELFRIQSAVLSSMGGIAGGAKYREEVVMPRIERLGRSNLLEIFRRTSRGLMNTYWWHDSATGLDQAIDLGASGCTTNPVIVWNAIKADFNKWTAIRDAAWAGNKKATAEQIGDSMTLEVVAENAALLEPIWNATNGAAGVISLQLAPIYSHLPQKMHDQGMDVKSRLVERGIENVVLKVPGTKAGYEVCKNLMEDTGLGVNVTVNYSRSQQEAFADLIEEVGSPSRSYLTQMNGRANEIFREELKSLGYEDYDEIQRWGMHMIRQSCYLDLYIQRGYRRTCPLGAAGRGPKDINGALMNGVVPSCITIFPAKQDEYDEVTRELNPYAMFEEVPEGYFHALMSCRSFRDYFESEALAPDDFNGLPSTIATLNQFVDEYRAFLAWIEEGRPT